ncbi:hypothetical protein LCGC14_1807430, partial [marine sediment metagenome]
DDADSNGDRIERHGDLRHRQTARSGSIVVSMSVHPEPGQEVTAPMTEPTPDAEHRDDIPPGRDVAPGTAALGTESLALRHGPPADGASGSGTDLSRTAYWPGLQRKGANGNHTAVGPVRHAAGAGVGFGVGTCVHGPHGGVHGFPAILETLRPRQSWVRKRRRLAVGRGSGRRSHG